MANLPTLLVYVSYNTAHSDVLAGLENAFDQYNQGESKCFHIMVKYSENSIQEGDSIVAFMDEIAVARFVVLLFSKAYFESPYCLYELLQVYEKNQLGKQAILLPLKLEGIGAAINTYTKESLIQAWQGQGDLTETTRNKRQGFCRSKLRELLRLDDEQVEAKLTSVYDEFISPWLVKIIPDKTSKQVVYAIEAEAKHAFTTEAEEFDKFILNKIKHELSLINNLQHSWENYSEASLSTQAIAAQLMGDTYVNALLTIQKWAKQEKQGGLSEWRAFFNRMQKIAGWLVLKSINQDWWIHNGFAFSDGTKRQGFVKLCLEAKHSSYSEVVVSKALRKSAQFLLNDQHKLIPKVKEYALREGHDFVFDSSPEATLQMLLIPIVTDLRKATPQAADGKALLEDLLNIAATNTDNFFYLVTEDYLQQLQTHLAPDGSGKSVLAVINETLKDKLFFIAINPRRDESMPQVTDNTLQAISLMENILLIDK